MERVIAYVDGFNLYFGLKSKGWQRYYWLNIQLLAQKLIKPNQKLIFTKYFTSIVSSTNYDPGKNKRQKIYLEALETLKNFRLYYGHYLDKRVSCKNCGKSWRTYEEKMTDVNIATELLLDAFNNNFDTAMLISGDSDLTAPIEAIRRFFPEKRIVACFPPKRHSKSLQNVANGFFTVGRKSIADSRFPDSVINSKGHILKKPKEWR